MLVKNIGVVGAGKMGHGIAFSAAMAGYNVILHDKVESYLANALNNIEKQTKKLVQKKIINLKKSEVVMNRIATTGDLRKFNNTDFIVEAVTESVGVKDKVFRQLDTICKKEAIIVSNTSTFSITALAALTKRPGQVAGMHFFLPPSKLVEIIRGDYTDEETVKLATIIAKKMGKVTVEVKKDSPGFIANRIYTPLFLEAFRAYEEELASKEDIDLAMKNSYLPIGPFELADIIGLDVIKNSLDYYQNKLGPAWDPPQSLRELVNAGRLGKKVGKGWYDY
jgi:3-hydroxybutyryl-CoA dehydrogenase